MIRSCGSRGPPRVKSRASRLNLRSFAAERVLETSAKSSVQCVSLAQKFVVGGRYHVCRLSASFSGEPHGGVIVRLFAFYRLLASHPSLQRRFAPAFSLVVNSPIAMSLRV